MGAPASTEPILDVRSVSKRFGGVEALKSVSLSLHAGEVVALAGDNGAGWTSRRPPSAFPSSAR